MNREEFVKEWDSIPERKKTIMGLFLLGTCVHCNKVIAPPSFTMRGDYAYHYQITHGIRISDLIDVFNRFWRGDSMELNN